MIAGRSAFDIAGANVALWRSIRNLGRSGLVATAISAVDAALWDLKAKLLGVSVAALLGRCRDSVPIYGSGGFTCYSDERLREQLAGWVRNDGCRWVKMKIGSDPARDPQRVGRRARRDRRRRSVRRCQWRVLGEAGAGVGRAHRRTRCYVVRGAGQLRRCRRPRADAGARAGRDGHRRRRIWLQPRRFPSPARPAVGRCAAGRRDALRRHHRLYAGRRIVRGAAYRSVGSLRAGLASAGRLRGAAAAPSRMVPRPCPHRAHAVRRGTDSPAMARSRPIFRGPASVSSSRSATQSASASGEPRWRTPAHRLGSGFWRLPLLGAVAVLGSAQRRHLSRRSLSPPATTPARQQAAQQLNRASALLAGAALADSAVEHYRGSFHNKAMYLPLGVAAQAFVASLHGAVDRAQGPDSRREASHWLAVVNGIAGSGFIFTILQSGRAASAG